MKKLITVAVFSALFLQCASAPRLSDAEICRLVPKSGRGTVFVVESTGRPDSKEGSYVRLVTEAEENALLCAQHVPPEVIESKETFSLRRHREGERLSGIQTEAGTARVLERKTTKENYSILTIEIVLR